MECVEKKSGSSTIPTNVVSVQKKKKKKKKNEDPQPFSVKDTSFNNVSEKRHRKIAELRSIIPKATVFTSFSKCSPEKIDNSDTNSADEDESKSLPLPLTSLYDPLPIN